MYRTREWRRHQRRRWINRRRYIFEVIWGRFLEDQPSEDWRSGGHFAKGKVHCSCVMCQRIKEDDMKEKHRRKEPLVDYGEWEELLQESS